MGTKQFWLSAFGLEIPNHKYKNNFPLQLTTSYRIFQCADAKSDLCFEPKPSSSPCYGHILLNILSSLQSTCPPKNGSHFTICVGMVPAAIPFSFVIYTYHHTKPYPNCWVVDLVNVTEMSYQRFQALLGNSKM